MDSEEEIHEISQSSLITSTPSHSHDDKKQVTERTFSGSFPRDLAWEILSRLPAKSIVRCRSVSNLWSSITTNPSFINSFAALSSAKPCLLLTFQKGKTLFVFSVPQLQNPIDPYSQVGRYEIINPNDSHVECSDSAHGLICFQSLTQLVIWNPTMRRFLTLPDPGNSLRCVRGFLGYDPIECKYKVLSIFSDEGIRVLTLGAQESWRKITKGSPIRSPNFSTNAPCINGILYYEAEFCLTQTCAIMSFDIRFETFHLIEYPMDYDSGGLVVPYERRLALICSMPSDVKIWILEDAENHKWSYKQYFYPPSFEKWSRLSFTFKGVTESGELVYAPWIFYETFNIVYFDLKRNTIKETKYEGLACDEFRRQKGLGFYPLVGFDVFPNHIESLFSL